MSDILTKDELKAFAEHPFFHDKIELLEKLKELSGAIVSFSNRESDEIY